MKKKYLKPEAEYISLEATDIITIGVGDGEDGGEEGGFDFGDLGGTSGNLD